VYLELYPEQRAAYQELRRGVLIEIGAMGPRVKQSSAMAKMHHGAKICGGMASLGHPDGPETSVKFDWIMDKLDEGDLSDDKVVMFINYKDTIRNIAIPRLKAAGIDYEIIWGDEPSREERTRSMNRFWQDDNCRVLIGTMAIEQSLNLQCARHLINVDTILNPARMEQLTGRIRRDGSAFQHVYVHNLYCTNTQEAGYPLLLEREQAVIDYVWQENSELFESLNPLALMQLIVA
jgi:SNF2 family DNA or RNA helicase